MRPSGLRKARSQNTDDRRPIEGVLATEGIHHDIKIDDNMRRVPGKATAPTADLSTIEKPDEAPQEVPEDPPQEPEGIADLKVVHENSSSRPVKSSPIAIPKGSIVSPPHTPTYGKGQAHDPLEDTLFLNIGTGEDFKPEDAPNQPVVSESPSNIDMNVYETAFREEVQRIKNKEEPRGRRPTLYLTRRVEHVKSLRDKGELIVDGGRTRDELKASLKVFVKKAQQSVDNRAEMQRLEGKEDLISRGWRGVRELKDKVDEAREIVREEERREGRRPRSRSRSSTPTRARAAGGGGSRGGTPVLATASSGGFGSPRVTPVVGGSVGSGSRSATPVSLEKQRA
jgi:[calcium/calmodulin-dependent protein kinase] kinase